jgi:hypothetical protein
MQLPARRNQEEDQEMNRERPRDDENVHKTTGRSGWQSGMGCDFGRVICWLMLLKAEN